MNRVIGPARRIWPRTSEAALGTLSLAVIALVVLTYSPTLARYASHVVGGNKYLALIDGMANPFRNRSLLLQSGLPIYDLKIGAQGYKEVERVVAEARQQGWMSDNQKYEVNGKFYYEGKEYDVSVRVRGDLPSHWSGPKKSWQIKFGKTKIVDGSQTLNEPFHFQGRRQINLVIPDDRDFAVAPFINETMRRAGLTVPRDRYVILRINGRMQGLYYEVEHFDDPLLASQNRPEATVFAQNDRAMHFEQYTKLGTPITADAKYDIGTQRLQISETASAAGRRAMEVVMEFSRNPTPESFRRAQAVLDWDKFLQFRALTTLFNTNHVRFGSDNLKLYYDPTRGLLEPIPWDVHLERMPKEPGTIDYWNSHGPDELQRAMLLDPQIRLKRNRILWKMVGDSGKRVMDAFQKIHDQIRPLVWSDVLTIPIQGEDMDGLKSDFEFNVRRVHKVLSHSEANLTYRLLSDNQASIDFAALNYSGIRWKELLISQPGLIAGQYKLYEDLNRNGKLDAEDPLFSEATAAHEEVRFTFEKLVLPTLKYDWEVMDGVHWEFFDTQSGRVQFILVGKLARADRHPLDWTAPVIRAKGENAVSDAAITSGVIGGTAPLALNTIGILAYDASHVYDLDAPRKNLAEFLAKYPQFVASSDHPGAAELRDQVTIDQTVIVPQSVKLIVKPGTDITMSARTSVVCYGSLIAEGTVEQPIRIHGNADQESWGVFAAVEPKEAVKLRHVSFSGGNQAQVNGIVFSGGVAVYNGDLVVEHCQFQKMESEDALNHKNGRLVMRDCQFSENAADSCDLDLVTGVVERSRFTNSGHDGLECSGSSITATDCRFEGNNDKGCSVGEKAEPVFVNCLFLNNLIGATTKDSSFLKMAFCSFVGNRVAIEVIRKKPFYDGGAGEFVKCVLAKNEQTITEDYFSRGQARLLTSLLDVPTQHANCLTTDIEFQSPESGDYRLARPEVAGGLAEIVLPNWFHAIEVPGDVSSPGVYISPITTAESVGSPPLHSPAPDSVTAIE